MYRKIILILVLFLSYRFILLAGTYSGGSGTLGDPYKIATTSDLIELSKTQADWIAGKNFIQTADIVFNPTPAK